MSISLSQLRQGAGYRVEPTDDGFGIVKSPGDDAAGFDSMVRDALASAGEDFVALPRLSRESRYDGVFILPFD